ncbi:hypothetical protein CDIK_0220 [Cucumispora dikerogammari]|nr:hypothetical protein CDIK_0220 [Cucumispora dikerogammari]
MSDENTKSNNTGSRSGDNDMTLIFIILGIVFVVSLIVITGSNDPSIDEYGNQRQTYSFGGHIHRIVYAISHPIYRVGYKITHSGTDPDTKSDQQDNNEFNPTQTQNDSLLDD